MFRLFLSVVDTVPGTKDSFYVENDLRCKHKNQKDSAKQQFSKCRLTLSGGPLAPNIFYNTKMSFALFTLILSCLLDRIFQQLPDRLNIDTDITIQLSSIKPQRDLQKCRNNVILLVF